MSYPYNITFQLNIRKSDFLKFYFEEFAKLALSLGVYYPSFKHNIDQYILKGALNPEVTLRKERSFLPLMAAKLGYLFLGHLLLTMKWQTLSMAMVSLFVIYLLLPVFALFHLKAKVESLRINDKNLSLNLLKVHFILPWTLFFTPFAGLSLLTSYLRSTGADPSIMATLFILTVIYLVVALPVLTSSLGQKVFQSTTYQGEALSFKLKASRLRSLFLAQGLKSFLFSLLGLTLSLVLFLTIKGYAYLQIISFISILFFALYPLISFIGVLKREFFNSLHILGYKVRIKRRSKINRKFYSFFTLLSLGILYPLRLIEMRKDFFETVFLEKADLWTSLRLRQSMEPKILAPMDNLILFPYSPREMNETF